MDANDKYGPFNHDVINAMLWLKGNGIVQRDKDLVEKMGYSKGTISAYINGKLEASPDFREKFENVFKLSLSDFQTKRIIDNPVPEQHIVLIELKTASGKLLKIAAEGKTEIELLNAFLEERERIITEKEQRQKDAELRAEKAEKEKDRLLSIIEKNLTELLINSRETKENMMDAIIEMQSEHKAMMDTLDIAAKQPAGTTVGNADILEGGIQQIRKSAHKQKNVHQVDKK